MDKPDYLVKFKKLVNDVTNEGKDLIYNMSDCIDEDLKRENSLRKCAIVRNKLDKLE